MSRALRHPRGKEASYPNLCASFADYCAQVGEPFHLCGLSLGGILALHYTLEHPEQVKTLVLIGTPHKIPGASFALQNAVFRFLPKSVFTSMAFDKRNTFALGSSMKNLDFSARAGGIRCPALILCGEKDRANLPSARFWLRTSRARSCRSSGIPAMWSMKKIPRPWRSC